jgi:hypothetical protein
MKRLLLITTFAVALFTLGSCHDDEDNDIDDVSSGYIISEIYHGIDADEVEPIKADLAEYRLIRKGTLFLPDGNNHFIIRDPDNNETDRGNVKLDPNVIEDKDCYSLVPLPKLQIIVRFQWVFTSEVNSTRLVYDVFAYRKRDSFKDDVDHLYFYEDLTQHYQDKYPNAGVRGVVRTLICDYFSL